MKTIRNINGVETKIYAETFEQEAYNQIEELCNFDPYLNSKIRIMPDAHAGKGCTVGTTMTITDKITPNLVGVDIGCLDCDTEFLSNSGWKKMSEYKKGDMVMQYNKYTDYGSFTYPYRYIVEDCEYFNHFSNTKGLDQMLSDEHKVLVWKGYKSNGYNIVDLMPKDLISLCGKLNKGYYGIKTSYSLLSNGSILLSDDEIRVDIMVSADGCLRKNNSIELHFNKDRKIKRAKSLLDSLNIKYSEYTAKDNSTFIVFNGNGKYTKDLSKYWMASKRQLNVVLNESILWDGHSGYRSYFSTTNKQNADIIQYAFTCNNIRAGISIVHSKNEKWLDSYIVTPTKNNIIAITNTISRVKSTDGKKYCFNLQDGYFIARRNGKVFITGNCGMNVLKLHDTEIDLAKLDKVINEHIPSGFNVHSSPLVDYNFDDLICSDSVNLERAKLSIGTLGGGNHFIEVNKSDKTGFIYLVIHTGSRNLGKCVCEHYQKVAASLRRSVDKDLAYLYGFDMEYYINDMRFAQDYAIMNRYIIAAEIQKYMGFYVDYSFESIHNYIDFENMILRKGAVSALLNQNLIIPINMRDGSLLCTGKGNEDWNYSAPHGAGRLMSRSKAKKTLSLDDFSSSMNGVYTTSVCTETLDEAPMAYKPIDEIVRCVADTVNIVDIIKPIYNFKAH